MHPQWVEDLLETKGISDQGFPSRSKGMSISDPTRDDEFIPQSPDWTSNQEFVEFLEELNCPEDPNNLDEWSDDVDMFMEGLSNPHKLEELWQQSKAKNSQQFPGNPPALRGEKPSTCSIGYLFLRRQRAKRYYLDRRLHETVDRL